MERKERRIIVEEDGDFSKRTKKEAKEKAIKCIENSEAFMVVFVEKENKGIRVGAAGISVPEYSPLILERLIAAKKEVEESIKELAEEIEKSSINSGEEKNEKRY